jgi:hypothetical protein
MKQLCLLVFVAVIGCEKKPETKVVTKPLDTKPERPGFPLLDPPAQSDPASREVVAKIVAAHTNGKPELLNRLRGLTLTREGSISLADAPVAGTPLKVVWNGTWPNRSRYLWTGVHAFPTTYRVLDRQVYQDTPSPGMLPPLTEKRFDDSLRDNYGNWLQTLVPLVEPDAIVAPGPPFESPLKQLASIRLWRPGQPQAILYYDPKTHLLGRIAFDGRENGLPLYAEHSLEEMVEIAGFKIAKRLYIRFNGREVMEFSKVDLAIGVDHPAKIFNEP